MLAARFHCWDPTPIVEEVPNPSPIEGESRIRLQTAVVDRLGLSIAGGHFPVTPPLPSVGSVEGYAVVVESASTTEGVRVIIRGTPVGVERDGCWAKFAAVGAIR